MAWCLPDVGMAYEIFSLRFLRQVVNDALLPLQALQMAANVSLKQEPFSIWQEGGEFKHTGHVAIITEVLEDKIPVLLSKT